MLIGEKDNLIYPHTHYICTISTIANRVHLHLWATCGPNYTALPPSTLADTTSRKVKHSDDSFKWQQQQVVMGSQLELPR